MVAFLARRLLLAVPVLLGVSIITFLALQLIPGDPAHVLLAGTNATPAQVESLRDQLGLNKPLVVQYLTYIDHLLHGDLGQSYVNRIPVSQELSARMGSTVELALGALVVALGIGIPMGLFAGTHPGSWIDRLATGFAVLGVAIPYFWLALLLVLLFSVNLHWLPSLSNGGFGGLILPSLALGWGFAALIARLLRGGLVSAYAQPYVVAARARGLSSERVLTTTVLRNACGPMVTALGLQIGNMLAGAVAIEVIFGRSGLGSLLYNAISNKDFPTIQGGVLFIAVIYVILNLLVDLGNAVLDPRTRRS